MSCIGDSADNRQPIARTTWVDQSIAAAAPVVYPEQPRHDGTSYESFLALLGKAKRRNDFLARFAKLPDVLQEGLAE
jgi:hypothetical protein